MSYLWTTIKVKNLEESIEFYQQIVGLKLQQVIFCHFQRIISNYHEIGI